MGYLKKNKQYSKSKINPTKRNNSKKNNSKKNYSKRNNSKKYTYSGGTNIKLDEDVEQITYQISSCDTERITIILQTPDEIYRMEVCPEQDILNSITVELGLYTGNIKKITFGSIEIERGETFGEHGIENDARLSIELKELQVKDVIEDIIKLNPRRNTKCFMEKIVVPTATYSHIDPKDILKTSKN